MNDKNLRPAARRIEKDLRLQRTLKHLHGLGPRAMAHAIGMLLDQHQIDPAALDALHKWCAINPSMVARTGGLEFAACPLHVVP